MEGVHRLEISLDGVHSNKLERLANRTGVPVADLASSLLARAIDDFDLSSARATEILNGVDGAFERALKGLVQARRGEIIPLDDI